MKNKINRILKKFRPIVAFSWPLKFLFAFILVFITFLVFTPVPTFEHTPYATVLESSDGSLLGARIASDGQWRFPLEDTIAEKFKQSILYFEDEYFYWHFGVNPISIGKAIVQNFRAGKIIRGGSTISMQVARLYRGNRPRRITEKVIEIFLTLKLELILSKEEILNLYAAHAPYGGNVVGVTAAAWRYYGRPPEMLSWAESATLAVLPNSPSLIYPGKNSQVLLTKRNRLLDKLAQKGVIDTSTASLSKAEPLPGAPQPLPNHAAHLLTRTIKEGGEGKKVRTTIDYKLQKTLKEKVQRHHLRMKENYIHNAAAIVVEIATGNVLAYVGNVDTEGQQGQHVDIITSNRSTGSVLKPILYAAAIDEGLILPRQLLPDIPVFLKGFAPQNFDKKFHGAVPANKALTRSYNVPFVHLLQDYGYEKFHQKLQVIGLRSLNKPAGHYGLSMILGGAESSLWEVSGVYASMARSLFNYFKRPVGKQYSQSDYHANTYVIREREEGHLYHTGPISASAIGHMLSAMQDLNRPEEQSGWERYTSSSDISWKTGTSYGFKDAWAIGLNKKYVVGVWLGNADGEGRPELVGVKAAAPLLFDIFSHLKVDERIPMPEYGQITLSVCEASGFKAGAYCRHTRLEKLPTNASRTETCPYHQLLHLDAQEQHQVSSACYPVSQMKTKPWFILPPTQAWYFKQYNADYTEPPEFLANCRGQSDKNEFMELIYPRSYTKVFVPKEIDGTLGASVFEVAHRNPAATIYWHLNEEYIGSTVNKHQLGLSPPRGRHKLHLVDDQGRELMLAFEVISE